ncbi:MAG: TadE/TadG family type IV pilus assembly protein [Rhodoferax sp.]|uniref:TadE/TadG family type IV pilus assembly protein n=1 Tax=Rhodoferax sp. TaxID=50421 RepID=UPI002605E136|nr:TadE/TadG family type IV pilus assembly protein [Rhodoferax sp.]MDD5333811.1 TadE/TadG family type IV pilus assembly protein [Rhodoferax sp.]
MAIVEFALVALLVFFPLLLGIMEFGRWLFTLNAAAEATRVGARLAVVCGNSATDIARIKERMRFFVGTVRSDQISITYLPDGGAGCNTDWTADAANRCESVSVELNGATFKPLIPYFGVPLQIPPFTTTLTREFMKSAGNPVCP